MRGGEAGPPEDGRLGRTTPVSSNVPELGRAFVSELLLLLPPRTSLDSLGWVFSSPSSPSRNALRPLARLSRNGLCPPVDERIRPGVDGAGAGGAATIGAASSSARIPIPFGSFRLNGCVVGPLSRRAMKAAVSTDDPSESTGGRNGGGEGGFVGEGGLIGAAARGARGGVCGRGYAMPFSTDQPSEGFDGSNGGLKVERAAAFAGEPSGDVSGAVRGRLPPCVGGRVGPAMAAASKETPTSRPSPLVRGREDGGVGPVLSGSLGVSDERASSASASRLSASNSSRSARARFGDECGFSACGRAASTSMELPETLTLMPA